jgi:hypothetical protein
MSKQPEAHGLADALENDLDQYDGLSLPKSSQSIADKAAAELRRLYALNGELLEALQLAKNSLIAFKFMPGQGIMPGQGNSWEDHDEENLKSVDAAITKAEAE